MNSKRKTFAIRVLMGLLLYNFVALAAMQMFGYSHFMDAFHRFGYPDWTRFFLAAVEIAGTALLLGPKTRPYGVGALAVLVIGAAISFVTAGLTFAAVPALALLGLLCALAWLGQPGNRLA